VKLTLPSDGIGEVQIKAAGLAVGHAFAVFSGWDAFLWPVAERWASRYDAEIVHNPGRLADLRARLRTRLETDGPWWTEKEGTE
jgi:hypothetical protein